MTRVICSLLIMTLALCSFAQVNDYEPAKSAGKLPKNYTTPSSKKYKSELKKISKNDKRKTRKNQERFYLESSFYIDDLIQSGKVLFNDPMSVYIKQVAAEILKDDKKTLSQLSFYAVRSAAVNAFATNNGVIFVNVGLLSQLENESQLAFILAHEISHFKEKHALELYLESKEIERKGNKGLFRQTTFDDAVLAKNNYSKELEIEADTEGLELYLTTDYSIESLDGAFDVLKYSYLAFDEIPFNKSFFETEYLKFPKSYELKNVKEIEGVDEDEDDTESTHPSIGKRRDLIKDAIENKTEEGRKKYLVSEEMFHEVQEIARYEITDYYLRDFRYYEGIYNAFLLLQQDKRNEPYLKKVITKSLYGITKFRNNSTELDPEVDYEDMEGEAQQLYYLLNELEDDELNVMALRYAWELNTANKEDAELAMMTKDLFQEMVNHHFDSINDFAKTGPSKQESTAKEEEEVEEEEKSKKSSRKYSKTDKIKKKKKKKPKTDFIKYAFVDVIEDQEFVKMFKDCKKQQQKKNVDDYAPTDYREERKNRKRILRKGYALNKKKVVVVNPFYLNMDFRPNKKGVKYIQTEESQSEFSNLVKENAKIAGVKATLLDANALKAGDVEKANEIMVINEWFSHELDLEDIEMPAFNQEKMNKIADKYGTDYFVWTGMISGRKGSGYTKLLLLYTHTLYGIYKLFRPSYESMYFSIVMNVRTGETEMVKLNQISDKDSPDVLNAHVFDTFFQIRSKRKK